MSDTKPSHEDVLAKVDDIIANADTGMFTSGTNGAIKIATTMFFNNLPSPPLVNPEDANYFGFNINDTLKYINEPGISKDELIRRAIGVGISTMAHVVDMPDDVRIAFFKDMLLSMSGRPAKYVTQLMATEIAKEAMKST